MPAILPDLPKVEAAIIELTNTVRAEAKLGSVTVSPQLTAAAKAYAALLARTGAFSHEADGTLGDRTGRTGYQHCTIAENLALHQNSRGFETRALAISTMEGWLNSPGHRKNIMTPELTEIGVAIAKAPDKDPKFITVQVFGRPQSLSIQFQVSNDTAGPVTWSFGGSTKTLSPHAALTMTACTGGPIALSAATPKPFSAKYEAAGGKNYVVVTGGPQGPLRVEVRERQTLR